MYNRTYTYNVRRTYIDINTRYSHQVVRFYIDWSVLVFFTSLFLMLWIFEYSTSEYVINNYVMPLLNYKLGKIYLTYAVYWFYTTVTSYIGDCCAVSVSVGIHYIITARVAQLARRQTREQ